MTTRLLTPALIGVLLCTCVPLRAQTFAVAEPAVPPAPRQTPPDASAPLQPMPQAAAPAATQNLAAAEPAVPNTPRQVTPQSVAAPPAESPDASHIDASDGQSLELAPPPSQSANDESDGVVVTVNDEPISDYELRQRMALVTATTTQMKLSDLKPEDFKRLRAQVLQKLEEEKMQFQEAQKKHITVSPVEVDKQINRILSQNNLTVEQMRKVLSDAGSDIDALRNEITGQIAWQKAVQDEYSGEINVTPSQIDAELLRAAEGATKPHFLVAEIFLAVDKSDQDAKVQKDAQNLVTQLQTGAPFPALANQFSQRPTAAAGGDIGWVYDGQLAPELNRALDTMKAGAVSDPIRSTGGYYILNLKARQEPLGTKIANGPAANAAPEAGLKLGRLLFPLGGNTTKEQAESAMKVAAQVRANFSGCEKLAELPKQIPGAVYFELTYGDVGPEFQKAVAAVKPGEMALMQSEAGIEMLGRCDARVEVRTAFTMPSRDEIESQLFDQQISALARRYLRDIKRDADVEVR